MVFTYAYEQLFSFSFHLLAFTKTAEPALRQEAEWDAVVEGGVLLLLLSKAKFCNWIPSVLL